MLKMFLTYAFSLSLPDESLRDRTGRVMDMGSWGLGIWLRFQLRACGSLQRFYESTDVNKQQQTFTNINNHSETLTNIFKHHQKSTIIDKYLPVGKKQFSFKSRRYIFNG